MSIKLNKCLIQHASLRTSSSFKTVNLQISNSISMSFIKALHAGHFEIYSKPDGVPLVAAGLKKVKDKSGKLVERPYTCFDV